MEKGIEYWAGLFDGEGCFCICLNLRKHKLTRPWLNINFMARIGMKKSELLLNEFKEFVGVGKVYVSNKTKRKEIYSWQTTNIEETVNVAKKLLPYLSVKKEQAEKMINVCNLYNSNVDLKLRAMGKPVRTKEVILKVIEVSINLNPNSEQAELRKNNKPMEYWKKIVNEIYDFRDNNVKDLGGMPQKYSDDELFQMVNNVEKEGYVWKKHRALKELVKYRFGSWEIAVQKANELKEALPNG